MATTIARTKPAARAKKSKSAATANTSSAKKKSGARPGTPLSSTVPREVLVRMYNVGFGDCFLVEFPKGATDVTRVLIDCGSIAAASMKMTDIVDTILGDVKDADGKSRIDVVVCTHRHADHISGFANPAWKDLEVKEVWFPWTEDPRDPDAKQIRESQTRLAMALESQWKAKLAASPGNPEYDQWLAMALNARGNQGAMDMLHEGFKSKPKRFFLSSDGSPTPVGTDALQNVSAYVLGPSKDKDVIRDMDPPAGTTYLRQTARATGNQGPFEPFGDGWPIDASSYTWGSLLVSALDEARLNKASSEWDPAITVALEKAVNGTSLVLAFEIDDAVLFFPGDAQWGTWDKILDSSKTVELLSWAKFWKVGHHGSHNATPKDFVSGTLAPFCCAMMSTKAGKWASIPRSGLIDALRAKGIPLARSDEVPPAPVKPFLRNDPSFVETRIPLGAK